MPAEIIIEKLVEGTGPAVEKGQLAVVHYTGWLPDTKKQFDSSVGGDPFPFTVGAGEVIEGWDIAVATMKVGDKIRITLPPHLAYGAGGAPPDIPPNATLMFDVELLEVHV